MKFELLSQNTAPEASREMLKKVQEKYGMVPNLMAVMATAAPLIEGYGALSQAFTASSLTPSEQLIVILATSYENECHYCMAAHTVIAQGQKIPADLIEALRQGESLADPKLETLRGFVIEMVTLRGRPKEETIAAFLAAGYTNANALEVVLGIGLKTLSNYTNHLADTPVDPAFASGTWSRKD